MASQAAGMGFLAAVLLLTLMINSTLAVLRCPLRTWKPTSRGQAVPGDGLRLVGIVTDSYIVRATVDGEDYLGTYDRISDETFFPPDPTGNDTFTASYEVLSNPEGCTTAWIPIANAEALKEFAIALNDGTYVGMATIENGNYAGKVDLNAKPPTLLVAHKGGSEVLQNGFQVLVSRSDGIKMTLINAEIALDLDNDDVTAIGSEEIRNNAEVTIQQTFEHHKQIKETFSNTISNTYTTRSVSSVGWDILIVGSKYTEEHTYTERTTQTWTTEKITDITVTRTIEVPPFASIQACSLVTLKENVEIEYTADALYTAPGLEPLEIFNLLKEDTDNPIDVSIVNEQVVKTGVKGTFKGAVALDSAFYIVELSDSSGGCIQAERRERERRRERLNALRAQIRSGNRTLV